MKKIYLLACSMIALTAFGQPPVTTTYSGNGKIGFGDVIGNGNVKVTATEDPHIITFVFTMGPGPVNDGVVIYIDSKDGGVTSTSGFTDVGDENRKFISGYDGTNRSALTFPSGFEPDFAISFKIGNGGGDDGFGGLWKLDNAANFTYVNSANLTPINGKTAGTYTLTINVSELELSSTTMNFVVTLVSNTAYRSNEFIGDPGPGGDPGNSTNIGQSPFTLTSFASYTSNALPVTLSNFTASANNSGVNLQWSTSQESNMDSYEIWRSADGNNFSKIGSVSALNSPLAQVYNYEDVNPLAGNNFYKLALVGNDGKVTFSKVVSVKASAAVSFKAYTTSSNRVLKIELNDAGSGNLLVEMSNSVGQKVFQSQINANGTNQYSVDLNKTLATGIYSVTISKDGAKYSKMIMVK